jgi:uncharacterized membrane protein
MPTEWLLPSWAPNVHPLVIHFPIVLVMTAAVVDLVDVAFERSAWLKAATTTLYVTGALSLIVAYVTGLQAASTVLVPGMAYPVITAHRQWALVTMAYCIVLATLRLVVLRGENGRSRRRRVALLAIGLVSVVLIQQTAERGARLVYEYGTGIIGAPAPR